METRIFFDGLKRGRRIPMGYPQMVDGNPGVVYKDSEGNIIGTKKLEDINREVLSALAADIYKIPRAE